MAAVLLVGLGLRFFLVAQGGQGYWPDEQRYGVSKAIAGELIQGNWSDALREAVKTVDHVGFKWMGVPVALLQKSAGVDDRWAAAYFAFFGWLGLVILVRVACRLGASRREQFVLAALLMSANTLFYYSRHLLPYDSSLFWFFAAWYVGLTATGFGGAFLAGAFSGIGFLTYNGYWLVGAVILVHLTLDRERGTGQAIRWALQAILGLFCPLVGGALLGAASGSDWVRLYRDFSGTINQGDFTGSVRFVWDYLWAGEGVRILVASGVLALGWIGLSADARPRLRTATLLAAACLFMFWFFCDVLQIFTLYGRTVRALMPFLCLGMAVVVEDWIRRGGAFFRVAAVCTIAFVVTGWTAFRAPLAQVFPIDFRRMAFERVSTLARAGENTLDLRAVNVSWRPEVFATPEKGWSERLLSHPHPYQFSPYQFEGLERSARQQLEGREFPMVLGRLSGQAVPKTPDGAPASFRLRLALDSGHDGLYQPIFSQGPEGPANFLGVIQTGDTLRFFLDVWGRGMIASPTLEKKGKASLEVELLVGAFLPDQAPSGMTPEAYAWLKKRLVVVVDDVVVWMPEITFNRTDSNAVLLATNLSGGSTSGPHLFGELTVLQIENVPDLRSSQSAPWSIQAGDSRDMWSWQAAWGKTHLLENAKAFAVAEGEVAFALPWPGPLRIAVRRPERPDGTPRPLLTTGVNSAGDSVFIRWGEGPTAVIGLDHWGHGASLSPPFAWAPGETKELVISLSSLCPPAHDVFWSSHENLKTLTETAVVTCGREVVFILRQKAHPCARDTVTPGANTIGASTSSAEFPGGLVSVRAMSLVTVTEWFKTISPP